MQATLTCGRNKEAGRSFVAAADTRNLIETLVVRRGFASSFLLYHFCKNQFFILPNIPAKHDLHSAG